MEIAKDRDRARRKRNAMRPAHFHFLSRDRPKHAVKVELGPFRRPYFARANKSQGQQVKGRHGLGRALISGDCTKKGSERSGLYDRRSIFRDGRSYGAAQGACRIRIGPAGRDRVPKDLTNCRPKTLRGLQLSARLDLSESREDLGSRYVPNWPVAEI